VTVLFTALVGLAIAAGVLGTLVPVLPGLALVWVACLVYGIVEGFGMVGWIAFGLISVLTAIGSVASVRMTARDTAQIGVTGSQQLVAVVFGLVGLWLIPGVGLFIGFALGIFLTQYRARGDSSVAWQATLVTLKAMLKGAAVQAGCAVANAIAWVIWVIAA
jgi:uncharacterized protein YqgC (DUF456 family)